nr:protein CCC1-like [Ipomoea batatas]
MAESSRYLQLRESVEDGEVEKGKSEKRRPKEPWKGEFVRSIVFAGLDAIVTSFSLISSISAGRLSSGDVLVLGFANLVADGISMGFGDFVSTSTERDVVAKEKIVAEWDVMHTPIPLQQELLQHYQSLGMELNDATTVVTIFAKYMDILVAEKMAAEKGLSSPLEKGKKPKPWKNGLITFAAFVVFGCAPILAFIVLIPFTHNVTHKFMAACAFSAFALALLGFAKAKIASQSYSVSVAITLSNGAIAGASAYAIGWTLRNLAGLED